jgi:DNA repair protein RadA/Sms
MAKLQSKYVCQACAYESPRWTGKCPNCGGWNTFVEEIEERTARRAPAARSADAVALNEIESGEEPRVSTGIGELDRVLGGGVVGGSVVLLGGDPGVGKSTLMMQMAAKLGRRRILYISGEESAKQIKLRSERLGLSFDPSFLVLAETDVGVIAEVIRRESPACIIVDSIQTMFRPELESSPGSIAQVRESTAAFTRMAKGESVPAFLIGHVTKEGMLAGPKIIEHMVDTVLQFEGERHYSYRILRAIKNRFGSTNEIGVFEMRETGLEEVKNPSAVFLSERSPGTSGSSVVASVEGTRPILIEVQALVSQANYGVAQRNTTGFDTRRLGLLIAVLEKRLGCALSNHDVFVNVAGGVRIDEPAVDLGIAASIVSSLRDAPVDAESVAVGEIGLSGEVRTVSHVDRRIQEAAKLGFRRVILPKNNVRGAAANGCELVGVERIDDAIRALIG